MDQLERGGLGVSCRIGETKLVENSESLALLVHPELEVTLEFVNAPWRLSTRDASAWRTAVERHARWLFEDSFRPEPDLRLGTTREPRTRDLSWSPLIEFDEIATAGAAWWILLRRSYTPGDELIEGRILMPIVSGLLTVSLLARDTMTGYRESALALLHDLPNTNAGWPQATQALFDAPRHDREFAEHCLSRVRRARQWLFDPNGGALVRTEPAPTPASGELVLEHVDCVVTPPSRFEYLPAGILAPTPGVAWFSGVVLGGTETPRRLHVCRLARGLSKTAGAGELSALARETLAAWTGAGNRNVELQASEVRGARGPEVHVHVRFVAGGTPRQEQQIWFMDADQSVFRIGVDAPLNYPPGELAAEVAGVRERWRRLPAQQR